MTYNVFIETLNPVHCSVNLLLMSCDRGNRVSQKRFKVHSRRETKLVSQVKHAVTVLPWKPEFV